jgi:hypothetical protein
VSHENTTARRQKKDFQKRTLGTIIPAHDYSAFTCLQVLGILPQTCKWLPANVAAALQAGFCHPPEVLAARTRVSKLPISNVWDSMKCQRMFMWVRGARF